MNMWHSSRKIARRLLISGDLVLSTPAHLGNGEGSDVVDMLIQRDSLDGRPLLPGTAIAGGMRAYLQNIAAGYRQKETGNGNRDSLPELLFGAVKGDSDGAQSPLIVEDSLGDAFALEIRDGVQIDPERRTAKDQAKYDLEVLPAGTRFPLCFELLLPADPDRAENLKQIMALALQGFEQGAIPIGARRSRGLGHGRVAGWQIVEYNLKDRKGLLDWLQHDLTPLPAAGAAQPIATLLTQPYQVADKRKAFQMEARFALASPLLIRSEQPLLDDRGVLIEGATQPDAVQLTDIQGRQIIPGSSLAGVLRARAERIACLFRTESQAKKILNNLFGYAPPPDKDQQGSALASRLIVHEAVIENSRLLVQSRVGIDRFTGGALDTALFHEAPAVTGETTLRITIVEPEDHDIGLLLLLLKDLWTGDLPLGGASSIGRGQLRGVSAHLCFQANQWSISSDPAQPETLHIEGDVVPLEQYVQALQEDRHAA
jgi:CRISPR/Cas system CSM-associated protein Csm3 (group 7 of RAMP superfamily)